MGWKTLFFLSFAISFVSFVLLGRLDVHVPGDLQAPIFAEWTKPTRSLLLGVPFYVYKELAWVNATFGNVTVAERSRSSTAKHADDYFFMKASLEHPMRTMDPKQAKLFVIPLLLNSFADRHFFSGSKHKLCARPKVMCDESMLKRARSVLNRSEWFRLYPEKHVVVRSHYLSELAFKLPKDFLEMLQEVNTLSFEQQIPNRVDRLRFPKMYVGNPCPVVSTKSHDVAMIARVNREKLHYFQDRVNVCKWLNGPPTARGNGIERNATHRSLSGSPAEIRVSLCGTGEQCPALAQARFGFHTRGDTLGSNRLMDTILSGTVPIFTRREQYDILPSWIDWEQLSVFLPMNGSKSLDTSAKASFLNSLSTIVSDEETYRAKHRAVRMHRSLLDWKTLYPFDTYMYMLQAELYPETRRPVDSSPWPALRLPPPLTESSSSASSETGFLVPPSSAN